MIHDDKNFPVNIQNNSFYNEQTKTVGAGTNTTFIAGQFDFLNITSAPVGTVLTLTIDGQSIYTLRAGQFVRLRFGVGQTLDVVSTVAGTLTIGFGLNCEVRDNPFGTGGGGGAVSITFPLNSTGIEVSTGGIRAYGYAGPIADFNNPYPASYFSDVAGIFTMKALTGDANGTANSGGGRSVASGFVNTLPSLFLTADTKLMRFGAVTTGANPIIITDGFGNFLPVYTVDGRYLGTGSYSANQAPDNAFCVPCNAATGVSMTSVAVTWGLRVQTSPLADFPITSVRASDTYFTLTGAFAAGATNLVAAVAGKRVKVYGYNFSNPVAANVDFRNTAGAIVSAQGQGVIGGNERAESPIFQTNIGVGLDINFSVLQANASVQLTYTVE